MHRRILLAYLEVSFDCALSHATCVRVWLLLTSELLGDRFREYIVLYEEKSVKIFAKTCRSIFLKCPVNNLYYTFVRTHIKVIFQCFSQYFSGSPPLNRTWA